MDRVMNLSHLKFAKLDFEDVKTLVNWAEAEGWNPGLHDAEVFYCTDPGGFWGFSSGKNLIAGGSIVSYNGDYGFMGFFIVKPEFRSQGIGRKLWYMRRDSLLSRLKPGSAIGMDGVVNMQQFYQQGGFEIAFRDERHLRKGHSYEIDPHISSISEVDFDTILAYDTQCFGFSRPQFLLPWLKQPDAKTFQYRTNDKVTGYAVVRKAHSGYKIGPLFADKEAIAEELYKACLNTAKGEDVYVDIPMNNPAAISLVKKHETTYVFECARMYNGSRPKVSNHKIFGLTSFELG